MSEATWQGAYTIEQPGPPDAILFPAVCKKQDGTLFMSAPRMSHHLYGDGYGGYRTGVDNGNGTVTWLNNWAKFWDPPNTDAIRIWEPTTGGWTGGVTGTATPVLIGFHSAGGTKEDPFGPGTSLITNARAAGYLVATATAGDRAWGNPASVASYVQSLYEYVSWNYNVSRTVLWAASMGGLAALSAASRGMDKVKGLALHYPVCSLANIYADNASYVSEINTAYGINNLGGASTSYAGKTVGADPYLRPTASYAGLRFRFYASAGDTSVLKARHADLMHAKVSPVAAESNVVATSGDHGDASNWDWADLSAFLARCV